MNAPTPAHLLPPLQPRPVPQVMRDALTARFGERCSAACSVREQHGRDESPFDVPPPDLVVFCESTKDVCEVLRLADHHSVPVIPTARALPSKASCWPCRAASASISTA